jgi:hypothetical protein
LANRSIRTFFWKGKFSICPNGSEEKQISKVEKSADRILSTKERRRMKNGKDEI